jgi:hypothetical protein
VPETVPLLCGVNAASNDVLVPAGIVNGKEGPCTTYRELVLPTEEIVTLAPVAPMVTGCFFVSPTATLPKFREVGLRTN